MEDIQRYAIYQDLFQEIKKEIALISKKVSQKDEYESIEERFAIFYFEYNGFYGQHSILLKNLRIIKYIIERNLIASKLKDICLEKGYSYNEHKAVLLRETAMHLRDRTEATKRHFFHPDRYPEPINESPFYDFDITLKYDEWKNISFIKEQINPLSCYSCCLDFMNKSLENLPYEVFKSIYYIYYGVYEGALVDDIKDKIKHGCYIDILFFEENKDIYKYITDKKEIESSSTALLPAVPSFSRMCIKQLAINLRNHAYITEEEIEIFVGLFFKNETTDCENRIINWRKNIGTLKFLFLNLYDKWNNKETLNGVWPIVTDVFRDKGHRYGDNTLPNMDKKTVQKHVGSDDETIVNIINSAKMYKEAYDLTPKSWTD